MDDIKMPTPVQGAAKYEAIGNQVWMTDTDGFGSQIDQKSTAGAAKKCAYMYQVRENKIVLKNIKKTPAND